MEVVGSSPSPLTSPDVAHSLRQRCRQAERKWKKHKLHVSLGTLRDSLAKYQQAVKCAKCQYLCSILTVLNPYTTAPTDATNTSFENFLHYFLKVTLVRQNGGSNDSFNLSVAPTPSAMFEEFEVV